MSEKDNEDEFKCEPMRQICDSPKIRALMDQIGKNIAAREAVEGPTLYGCSECRDQGFILYERKSKYGYIATYSKPCTQCLMGFHIANGNRKREAEQEYEQVGGPFKNRLLKPADFDREPPI